MLRWVRAAMGSHHVGPPTLRRSIAHRLLPAMVLLQLLLGVVDGLDMSCLALAVCLLLLLLLLARCKLSGVKDQTAAAANKELVEKQTAGASLIKLGRHFAEQRINFELGLHFPRRQTFRMRLKRAGVLLHVTQTLVINERVVLNANTPYLAVGAFRRRAVISTLLTITVLDIVIVVIRRSFCAC